MYCIIWVETRWASMRTPKLMIEMKRHNRKSNQTHRMVQSLDNDQWIQWYSVLECCNCCCSFAQFLLFLFINFDSCFCLLCVCILDVWFETHAHATKNERHKTFSTLFRPGKSIRIAKPSTIEWYCILNIDLFTRQDHVFTITALSNQSIEPKVYSI